MAMRTKAQELLYKAASTYAQRGWSVIPLESGTKKARVNWQGYQAYRANDELLRDWWVTRFPGSGVAIVCGEISNLVVIDIDNPTLAAQDIEKHGGLPRTPCVKTAKGKHFYFMWPGFPLNGRLPWGDLKGQGGYVVAPPSIHPLTKQPYEWEVSPRDCPLAPLPEWIVELCRSHRIATAQTEGQPEEGVAIAPPVEERIGAGQRNNTLASIAGTMRRRGMTPDEIYPSLAQINRTRCDPPLDDAEIRDIANSMARYAPTEEVRPLPQVSEPAAQALNAFHTTDMGNSEALAWLYGDTLRFDHSRQQWLLWDGVRWCPDKDGGVERLAREAMRQRLAAAAQEQKEEGRKALVKWATGGESRAKLQAMLELGTSELPLAATGDQFDTQEWLLACSNGVVDLQTGELTPGEPESMLTLSTNVRYDPDAQCPRWLQFLDEIFSGDASLISFIRRAIGYSLTGSTREQCLFLCHGAGANGKSVFLGVLHSIFGEFAHNASFATFLEAQQKNGADASPDLMALKGARLVTASEVKEDRRLNEARIKSLTGGDPVTARPLWGRLVTFRPTFKLWLAVNHRPIIREAGPAIWRRIRLIPFKAYFPPETADSDLSFKLEAEASGILAWAVIGCLAWQADGLPLPEAIVSATAAYHGEQDMVGAFLEAHCITGEGKEVSAAALYKAYKDWCNDSGEKAMSSIALGQRIGERFPRVHHRDGNYYHGMGLVISGHEGPLI